MLVQKPHWNNWWDFPQGGVNDTESLEQAITRELQEELGTRKFGVPVYSGVTHQRLFSLETFQYYRDKGFIGKELFYLAVEFRGRRENIILGDDLSDKIWCQEQQLLQLIYQEQMPAVQKVLTFMRLQKII